MTEPTAERYLATYVVSRFAPPMLREVYAPTKDEALELAKAYRSPWYQPKGDVEVYVSGPLHPSADHNGSTHGD